MKKYYIKKASQQDASRTVVVNNSAIEQFFGINTLTNRDDKVYVKVQYDSNPTVHEVRIVLKQDKRIDVNRANLNAGDLICYENLGDRYNITFIKLDSPNHRYLESKLNKNFLLTDTLTDNDNNTYVTPIIKSKKENMPKFPLNQILYGPPGTGKTYSTVKKSLEILDKVSENTEENYETFKSLLNKRIFFVTMHPSFSYEDFVQGVKPETNDKGELVFKVKDGVFKKIAEKAKLAMEKQEVVSAEQRVKFDLVFNDIFNDLIENKEPLVISRPTANFSIIDIANGRMRFATSNGNTQNNYNLSIETLRKCYTNKENNIILSGNRGYYDSLTELFLSREKDLSTELIESNRNIKHVEDYVLILDEINRANISKVFGELITLLEEDKRMGAELEMSVLLPSGEEFSIPSNLYIIGTMNTADKSIALVDIALRRRFQFEAMYPDEKVIQDFIEDAVNKENHDKKIEFFKAINTYLRKDKGVDFQIGHAYFLNERNINEIINQNILPLLVEYYRNDSNKVKKIMNEIDFALDDTHFDNTGLLKYNGK